jgi:hypothetical protein
MYLRTPGPSGFHTRIRSVAVLIPKMRSFSYQLPFLPRHKSIGESTLLARVLADGAADYTGETGIVPGRFRVSARLLPVSRDGALVDRVVALLFDPDADNWVMRQSG